jgi:hypothetical protein
MGGDQGEGDQIRRPSPVEGEGFRGIAEVIGQPVYPRPDIN